MTPNNTQLIKQKNINIANSTVYESRRITETRNGENFGVNYQTTFNPI